jgi:hypothetical protein
MATIDRRLKEVENKLFKESAPLKGSSALSIANTVQAVWQHQMVLVGELWPELLLTEICR